MATRTGLYLSSPTKGEMELVVGNVWEVKENDLPEFEWVPSVSGITSDVERRVAIFRFDREFTNQHHAGDSPPKSWDLHCADVLTEITTVFIFQHEGLAWLSSLSMVDRPPLTSPPRVFAISSHLMVSNIFSSHGLKSSHRLT